MAARHPPPAALATADAVDAWRTLLGTLLHASDAADADAVASEAMFSLADALPPPALRALLVPVLGGGDRLDALLTRSAQVRVAGSLRNAIAHLAVAQSVDHPLEQDLSPEARTALSAPVSAASS